MGVSGGWVTLTFPLTNEKQAKNKNPKIKKAK